jgi:ATP-binding cassette subfamily A (ABC1) protein 3
VYIVKERENNVKHQQIVSGVSLIAYWGSLFVIDYAKWAFCAIWTLIMILVVNIRAYLDGESFPAVFLLLMFGGIPVILLTYVTSYAFKSPAKAQYISFLMNFLSGCIMVLVFFILRMFESTRSVVYDGFEWILRFQPTFAVIFGVFETGSTARWEQVFKLDTEPKAFSQYGCVKSLCYILITPLLWLGC